MVSYLTLLDFLCSVFHECSWSTGVYQILVDGYRVPQKECAPCRDWKGSLGEAGDLSPPMVLRIVCLCQSLFHAIYFHLSSHRSLGEGGKGADAPLERKQGVFLLSWEERVQTFLWHIALKKFERLFYPYHVTMETEPPIANCKLALFFLFHTYVQHVWPPSEAVRSPDLQPHLCKFALEEELLTVCEADRLETCELPKIKI